MSIYADPLFIQAEIDRRLELFGVEDAAYDTPSRAAGQHRGRTLARRAVRALTGRTTPAPAWRSPGGTAARLPRHP